MRASAITCRNRSQIGVHRTLNNIAGIKLERIRLDGVLEENNRRVAPTQPAGRPVRDKMNVRKSDGKWWVWWTGGFCTECGRNNFVLNSAPGMLGVLDAVSLPCGPPAGHTAGSSRDRDL